MTTYNTIAELQNFIVLDSYTKLSQVGEQLDFTMNWAKADNMLIKDLKDFTATFFQKNTLLQVLLSYAVFDTSDTLLIMRPYQIAATERLIWKIRSSYQAKVWSTPRSRRLHLAHHRFGQDAHQLQGSSIGNPARLYR